MNRIFGKFFVLKWQRKGKRNIDRNWKEIIKETHIFKNLLNDVTSVKALQPVSIVTEINLNCFDLIYMGIARANKKYS